MNERYDALDRLMRLRAEGAISDSEFEAEKRRILGASPAPSRDVAEVEAEPEQQARRNRKILFAVAAVIIVALAIAGGIWLGRDVSGGRDAPEANVAMPAENQAAFDDNLVAQAAAPTVDLRTLPIDEQLARAFAAAFGTGGAASQKVGGRTIDYKPGKLIWVGDRAILISPGTAIDNCHACYGTLAIHYLTANGDSFQVTGSWLDAVPGAGFGAPPKWKLSGDYTTGPAIYEEGGFTGQGCTSASATITELAPSAPVRSGPIRIVYSNASDADENQQGAEIEARYANIKKDQGFDVVYTGTQAFTEHWAKDGPRFVLKGGETRMPQC